MARDAPPQRKALGQHFLRDVTFAERAVAAAALAPDDVVLEVGPGSGVLTRVLAGRCGRVIAIETDARFADTLRDEAPANVTVVTGDALKEPWPPFDACVSNLPYQISSPFLFRLLATPFRVAVLLVQKEFADRLAAASGSRTYGRLTVMAARLASVKKVANVPRGAFQPPPAVASALVKVTPRDAPLFPVADEALFAAVVRAAFTQRRKTIASGLREAAHLVATEPDRVHALVRDLPQAGARPEALEPAAFGAIADHLHAAGLKAPGGDADA